MNNLSCALLPPISIVSNNAHPFLQSMNHMSTAERVDQVLAQCFPSRAGRSPIPPEHPEPSLDFSTDSATALRPSTPTNPIYKRLSKCRKRTFHSAFRPHDQLSQAQQHIHAIKRVYLALRRQCKVSQSNTSPKRAC